MQNNYLLEKGYKHFLVENETGAARKIFNSEIFSILIFFHVFLIKLLNIISADQNRNMHIFLKKNFQNRTTFFYNFFLVA